jgi:hypothetical protein
MNKYVDAIAHAATNNHANSTIALNLLIPVAATTTKTVVSACIMYIIAYADHFNAIACYTSDEYMLLLFAN